jgi:GNAT superfamily N-acetyltransferase
VDAEIANTTGDGARRSLVVRRFDPSRDDPARLGGFVANAYRALDGALPDDDPYYQWLADVAGRSSGSSVLVAEIDGVPVGCVTYVHHSGVEDAEHDDPEAGHFRALGVEPSAQGSGAGRALVEACIDLARADGMRRVRIHTLEAMVTARPMYERMGFVRDVAHDEWWDDVHGLAYMLDLT